MNEWWPHSVLCMSHLLQTMHMQRSTWCGSTGWAVWSVATCPNRSGNLQSHRMVSTQLKAMLDSKYFSLFFPFHHIVFLLLLRGHFLSFPIILCVPPPSFSVTPPSFPAFPLFCVSFSLSRSSPIVSRSSLATVPCGVSREEETGRSHSTKKGAFHEIFSLSELERPLAGKRPYCRIRKNNNNNKKPFICFPKHVHEQFETENEQEKNRSWKMDCLLYRLVPGFFNHL